MIWVLPWTFHMVIIPTNTYTRSSMKKHEKAKEALDLLLILESFPILVIYFLRYYLFVVSFSFLAAAWLISSFNFAFILKASNIQNWKRYLSQFRILFQMTHFLYITLLETLSKSIYMFHCTSFNFFLSGSMYMFLFQSTKLNFKHESYFFV